MHTRDGHIVHQCLSGNTEAFALLVDKYKERIFALVYAKVGQFEDAEDLTQDIFLNAYKKLSTLRRWDNFYPWLYSIAANRCKNFYRAQKLQVDTMNLLAQNPNHQAAVDADSEEARVEQLHEALASLPEMHRQVLVLRYMAGMKSKEIAETLRVSPNAINQRLMRARAKLKAVFNEEMIQMMHTAIAERKLQPGFTAHVVELISEAKIQTAPHKTALPLGLSAAGGIILLLLSLSLPHSPLFPLGEWLGGYLPLKTQVVEDGDLPVDAEATRVAILSVEEADGDFGRRPKPPKMPAAFGYQDYQTWSLPNGSVARLGKGVMGGSDRTIAFSPDGKHLALASGIGIWIYDVGTAHELALLTNEHATLARSVAYSPDGKILASGSGDGTIQLWVVETGQHFSTSIRHGLGGPTGAVDALAFSPDGTTLASGAWEEIKLWDVESQAHLATLKGHKHRIFSVAFSPNGKILASGAEDDTIKLWDVATGKNLATLKRTSNVNSLAFSPDGATLATADKNVELWDVSTARNITTLKHTNGVYAVAYSPDGATLVATSWNEVKLWDVPTKKNVATLKHKGSVGAVAFSLDGKTLASVNTDRFGGSDGTVKFWNLSTKENFATLEGHTERIPAVAFSPDGTTLATALRGGTIKLWAVGTGKLTSTLHGAGGWSLAYSPDGETLALGMYD